MFEKAPYSVSLQVVGLLWIASLVVAIPTLAAVDAPAGVEKGVIVPAGTDLEVTKNCDSATARPICTVTLRNNGPVTAEDVVVIEDPPDGTFARRLGNCFGDNAAAAPVGIDNIAVGNVANGQELSCSFEMTGAAGVSLNLVEVTSSTAELAPADNSATAAFVISALSIPTLDRFWLLCLIGLLAGAGLLGLRRLGL